MSRYDERKKAVRDIVCEACIVRVTCSEYCGDMDYLIIMCADARNQAASITELEEMARETKEDMIQLERSNEGNFGI